MAEKQTDKQKQASVVVGQTPVTSEKPEDKFIEDLITDTEAVVASNNTFRSDGGFPQVKRKPEKDTLNGFTRTTY